MAASRAEVLWYFSIPSGTCGPLTLAALREMARKNHLRPDSLVWNNADFTRVRADSLPFLFHGSSAEGSATASPGSPVIGGRVDPSLADTTAAGRGDAARVRWPERVDGRRAGAVPGPASPRPRDVRLPPPGDLFPSKDRQLVEGCLAGRPEAWDLFVTRFAGLMAHVIERTTKQLTIQLPSDAREELLAAAIVEIMRQDAAVLRAFRGKSSLATFLTVVLRRVVVQELEKQGIVRIAGNGNAGGAIEPQPSGTTRRDTASSPKEVAQRSRSTRPEYVQWVAVSVAALCLGLFHHLAAGHHGGHRFASVSGTVRYKDGSPLPVQAIKLRFYPLARPARATTKPPLAHATVNGPTGAFTQATSLHDGDGVALGLCRVTVHDPGGGGLPPTVIDDRYQFERSTPLIVDTRQQRLTITLDRPNVEPQSAAITDAATTR